MQVIIDWLNEARPGYQEGIKLYIQYGRDSILKKSFTNEPESTFKRQKLRSALQQLIINKKSSNSSNSNLPDKVFAAESYKYWPPFPISDKIVLALYNKWKPLYISMINIQSRLYDIALAGKTDKNKRLEACQLAHQVLEMDDQCDDIYQKRDYYYVHGLLPDQRQEEESEVIGDPVRWATLMKNAERYVREFKLKVKKFPDNEKLAAKLIKHEETVLRYRQLLKLD